MTVTVANKVPFFLAGNGAYLRFRTADLIQIRQAYAPAEGTLKALEEGKSFEHRWESLVRAADPVAVSDGLKAALKKEDGRTPYTGVDFDDLPFGVMEAIMPLIDAMVLSLTGRSYAELLQARGEEARGEPDPPMSPEMASTPSSESAGQGSPSA